MEEDLITAAFGPMGRLLRRLHSLEASSDHRLPEGISADEIRFLTEGLEGLYNHLKDLPEADLGSSFTPKWWIKEVRELAYDTEDFFDEVMQSGAGDGAVVRTSARLSTISRITSSKRKQSRPQIAQGFSALMARVDDVRERCKSFQLAPETATEAGSWQAGVSRHTCELSLDLPVSAAPISDVCVDTGSCRVAVFEEPMKKLVNFMAFGDINQKQLKVVPIFGPAGVGKTTVARTLYKKYGGEFQCRAFIRVSRNPDMRTLLTGILSQIKAPPAHAFSDAQDLIDSVINHLQGKRYFIIVDDLWTASLWDIISRAFPYGDCCSRILTTTQIEDVALACSDYESEYVFKMGPLGDGESRKLFFSAVFGSEGEGGCPKEFEVVAHGIIRKCGGLPLSTVNIASLLLPSKPNLVMEKWGKVERSLPPTLRTDPTSQGMKDVLSLIYNKLPLYLKTCLLYLAMYPEGHTIWKDDLLKQWFAESFARDTKHGYFEELVRTGLIQPVDTNYHGEVLSCTVNHMVLDLLRYKSMEDNFIVALNYFESTLGHPDKVRRLSIQFRGAKSAKIPESISVSQVRSLVFSGFSKCLPSILDWRLLRVLILHMWGDQDETSFDLTRVGELFQLRYLNIECDISVDLPDKIEGLKYLETLHVDAKLSAVPSDIGHLEKLLYLRLPSEVILPDGFACMTSLCTLGYFDLSRNSEDSVKYLGELKNLQNLQLTCCAVESFDNLENNKMKCLGLVLGKLRSLRCLTLVPASGSSNVNTDPQDGAGSLSMSISFDGLSSVSPAPVHLQRLEFSRHCCIFSRLPKWTGELSKLCILKIAVRMLSREDTETLKGLPALTALCVYIFQTSPTERIVFGKEGFSVLRYFKYRCSAPWLEFQADAMPNLQKLKLGFNTAMWAHHNSALFISIEHLPGLKEISVKIWGGAGAPVESILTTAIRSHPRNPKISGQLVNWNFGGEIQKESSDKNYRTQHVGAGEDDEIQVSRIPVQSMSSSPLPVSGATSKFASRNGATLSNSSSYVSVASVPRSEGEILESANVKAFTFNELRTATRNFRTDMLLGEGGFGSVFKGWIDEKTLTPTKPGTGMVIAVKKLNQEGYQGHREWLAEVNYLGQLSNPNLVKLVGYCVEDEQRLLVYEFIPRGSLESHLFGRSSHFEPLSWNLRMKIAIGAAKGLAFLHSDKVKVIYRDFKTSNILLDASYDAKLSDFGLAKDGPTGDKSHVSTRVMGTYGYAAPEYLATGHLTTKSNVFSFGVVLLEMLSGRRAVDKNRPNGEHNLVEWARPYLTSKRRIFRAMDARLGGQYSLASAQKAAALVLQCLSVESRHRPSMEQVVTVLAQQEELRKARQQGGRTNEPMNMKKVSHLCLPINKLRSKKKN